MQNTAPVFHYREKLTGIFQYYTISAGGWLQLLIPWVTETLENLFGLQQKLDQWKFKKDMKKLEAEQNKARCVLK